MEPFIRLNAGVGTPCDLNMRVETICRIRMHLGDQEGHMLDEIVQTHRNTKAARHLLALRHATSC